MKNSIEYKGYLGSVNYNNEDKIFYGRVEYIRSLISYEGHDVESLQNSFLEAVDDYLELAHNQNIEPEKLFKGSFNIRTGSDLHRRVAIRLTPSLRIAAKEKGINLNKLVNEALEQYLKSSSC